MTRNEILDERVVFLPIGLFIQYTRLRPLSEFNRTVCWNSCVGNANLAATLRTCVRKVLGSNAGREI